LVSVRLQLREIEDIRSVKVEEKFKLQGYSITLDGVDNVFGPNYKSRVGKITVESESGSTITLAPEKRFYPVQDMVTTEASINSNIFRDIYIVLGDKQDNGSWVLRTYIKPFVVWIWIGAIVMSLGGILSLSDRKYRLAFVRKKNRMEAYFT